MSYYVKVRPQRTPISALTRGCLLLFTLMILFGVGSVIAAPMGFRLLPDQYQRGLARRLIFLNNWLPTDVPVPTREYTADQLPTAENVNAAAVIALLKTATKAPSTAPSRTPTVLPTATPTATSLPTRTATSSPTVSLTSSTTAATAAPTVAVTANPPITVTITAIATETATIATNQPTQLATADQAVTVTATDQSATPGPTETPTDMPLPLQFSLGGFTVVPQGWNDCGPANLTQVLNGYGLNTTQEKIAAWLKPNYNSKNVSPWQLAAYVNQFTAYRALSRVNGNLTLLKKLLVAGFRFIIETGFTIPDNPSEGWMGHYLTPVGYDDGKALFYGYDSYLGDGVNHQGRAENADDLDNRWQQFNRVYIIVYPQDRADELSAILGPDADVTQNAQGAVQQAIQDATNSPTNPYAWFNLGSSNVILQNYKDAATAYDQARSVGGGLPWRMLWYQFGPFAAYYHVGDYKTMQQLIDATLGTTHFIEEPYYWRGLLEAAQKKQQPAIGDLSTALKFNPNNRFVADALNAARAGSTPTAPEMP
jgi:tetratricopeptide (TPR) repeat protein